MTIEEAIRHYKDEARENRVCTAECAATYDREGAEICHERANEYAQLAAWLEELRERREREHGRWLGWTTSKWTGKENEYGDPEYKDYRYFQCADCKRRSAVKEAYCPSCGRRMDGE